MVKLKTTKKEMEQGYHRIVHIGYCEAQALLKYRSPFAYSCGVYGWNCDYYDIDGVLIATGYRGLPDSKKVRCDYKVIRTYEALAEKAQGKEAVEAVLQDFINYVRG